MTRLRFIASEKHSNTFSRAAGTHNGLRNSEILNPVSCGICVHPPKSNIQIRVSCVVSMMTIRAPILAATNILGTIFGAILLFAWGGAARTAGVVSDPSAVLAASPNTASQPRTPVIVELFTSEGCSDCPPADRLLYQLDQTQPVPAAEIIPLEQHVDYWDDEGWRDPFSSSQFTRRQKDYVSAFNDPSPYTPQMVVDGAAEFVGSDSRRALTAIARQAHVPKADLRIEQRTGANSGPRSLPLAITLTPLTGENPKHGADVLLAVTEDDLASNITGGENAGSRLIHRAVVRQLVVLGRVHSDGTFSAEPDLSLSETWKRGNLRVVAFVQDRGTRQIRAAASISLARLAR